jgi:hypothetical protein
MNKKSAKQSAFRQHGQGNTFIQLIPGENKMHITGMMENVHTQEVLEALKAFFSVENKKVSITEVESRLKNRGNWQDYCAALSQAGTDVLIIRIREEQLKEALESLTMDAVIVNDNQQWQMMNTIISQNQINSFKDLVVILNSDIIKSSDFSDEMKCRLLLFGFNAQSKVTTSSTGEPSISGQFLCCVKERLTSASGKTVEPQEFVMNLGIKSNDPYSILAAASLAVLNDVDLNKVGDKGVN